MGTMQEALIQSGLESQEKLKRINEEKRRSARGVTANRRTQAPAPRASGKGGKSASHYAPQQAKEESRPATAPYNFVSLAPEILASPLQALLGAEREEQDVIRAAYQEYLAQQPTYTGSVELTLTTRTPCFIGGNREAFFAPTGRPRIPGSSLRGMTRNLFKLVTCGAMRPGEDFDDRHLYFRCLMAPEKYPAIQPLYRYYKKRMRYTDANGKERNKAHPGFLVRIKNDYFICSAQCTSGKFRDTTMEQTEKASIVWCDEKEEAYCLTGYIFKNKNGVREADKKD